MASFLFFPLEPPKFPPHEKQSSFRQPLEGEKLWRGDEKTFVSRDKFVQQSSAEDVAAAASEESSRTQFLSRANAAGNLSSVRIYLRGR